MEIRLLGPVEVYTAGRPVDAGQPRQRCVLAALAADVGRPVPADTLVDRVWGDDPPRQPRQALYFYLTGIRKTIERADPDGTTRLIRRSNGYVLDIDADRVDIHRFRRLVGRSRDPARPAPQRLTLLRQALDLWRGTPLADLPGAWPARTRTGWQHEHLDTVIAWARTELRDGRGERAVGPLTALVVDHPLNESLAATLMQVLHAAGRGADALDHYARTRTRLAEDLGINPGPELQRLHQAILRGSLDHPTATPASESAPTRAGSPAAGPGSPTLPAQLPLDVYGFTGRHRELALLDTLLASEEHPTAVLINAVSGTAGVGKTALAVHWAHRVRDAFPDGQLYVNLRGFDATESVLTPAEAVRRFLDTLGVPAQRIPSDVDAQAALYRSLLADKRMLVVLDNARDADQVRPLLPGTPGCLVLVTSRNRLTSLIAAEGAHPLPLDVLTTDEARDLLTRRLGVARVAAQPHAVDDIIAACARLPLALAIIAANAATQPHLSLAVLADQLRHGQDRLDVLATGDTPTTEMRAVFSWSYQALTADAARLFRLLGLHPGPEISAEAAASLAAMPAHKVRSLLNDLAAANLLVEQVPGRYTFHDLLRAYATEQAHTHDSDDQRHAAIHRMLDHYLHTAHTAARTLDPHRDPIILNPPQPGTIPEHPADHNDALAWFAIEHPVLLAAVGHAAATGFDPHTWQLAWTLADFLDRRGQWHDWLAVLQAAAAAARRLDDLSAQAGAHRLLGRAYTQLSRLDEAHTQLRHALDLFGQAGDRVGQARAHNNLAGLCERQGRHAEALDHARHALDLCVAAGHRGGQATALNSVGWYHAQLGDHQQALTACQQALTLLQELGDRPGEAATWDSLGYTHHHLGHHNQAIASYHHALQLYRDLGDRHNEADTLINIGDTHHAAGHPDAARDTWYHALTILDDLDHPDAERVRTKLHHVAQPTTGPTK